MKKTMRTLGALTSAMMLPLAVQAADMNADASTMQSMLGAQAPSGMQTQPSMQAPLSNYGVPALINTQKDGMTVSPVINRSGGPAISPEFSRYVSDTIGQNLSLYGSGFFTQSPSTFAPLQNQSAPDNYTIGSGDELQIRGWGMVDIDLTVHVDRSGAIYIPRVGNVNVAGVQYKDLQGYLKKAIGRIFTNFDLSVSLAQTRAIQVFVTGFAQQPGSYQVSSLSTLINTLFSVGGASPDGSLRRIEVKRGGKTINTFDLYEFIRDGNISKDISLKDGDIIHIPSIGNLIALTGLVKQPAIYETLPNETLAALINKAGGVQPIAELSPLQLEVVDKGRIRTIDNTPSYSGLKELLGAVSNTLPQQGGIYRLFSTEAIALRARETQNYVKVDGEIKTPGSYKLNKGETLRELLTRIGGTTEDAYLYGTIVSRPSIKDQQQKTLLEAVDRFERDSEAAASQKLASTSVSDNIAAVQAELQRNRQRAKDMREVQAIGRIALEFNDHHLKLKDIPDLPLENGDSIYIPRQPSTINVFGAVSNSTAFMFRSNRNVNDYLELAGGIQRRADIKDVYILKADGTAYSHSSTGWFTSLAGYRPSPGDSIIVPEAIERGASITQNMKEWTSILYQFGLGAAGLKVLKD